MEERNFCQCCGMPLDKPEDAGTEADGTLSGEYCRYCYQNGAFTAPEATMEDMIAFNLKFNAENGFPMGPQEEAEQVKRLLKEEMEGAIQLAVPLTAEAGVGRSWGEAKA